MTKKAIVVVGMHRAGTSAIAKSLESIGIDLGERLIEGRSENRKGFFEDRRIVNLNEEILFDLESRWENVFLPAVSEELAEKYSARAGEIIDTLSAANGDFGFKDPRVTRLFPFWKKVLMQRGFGPFLVMANRHPASVARSLANRDYYPNNYSLILWLCYQASALEILLEEEGFIVDYDRLMDQPVAQIERMSRLSGNPVDHSVAEEFAGSFVDQSLRHSTSKQNAEGTDQELDSLSIAFYEFLEALSGHDATRVTPEQADQARSLIRDIRAWFEANRLFIADLDAMGFGLKKRLFNKIFEKERELAAAESRLNWIEGKAMYRFLSSVKRSLF